MQKIESYAFDECTELGTLRLDNGVNRLNSYAFNECAKLSTVYIPGSMLRIEAEAFNGCGVKDVYYEGSQKRWNEILSDPNEFPDAKIHFGYTPKPATPSSVKAASAGYSGIKLSWLPSSSADGYVIYRSTSKTGSFGAIKTITSGSTAVYSDTGLTTNKYYYYKLRAYDNAGDKKVYSDYSAAVSAKPLPAKPASVKAASAGYSGVKLSWGKVSGANDYTIYRSTDKTGTYSAVKTLGSGSTVTYTDSKLTCGTTYYYKLRACRTVADKKVYGGYSAIASAKPVPAKPASLTLAKSSAASIDVSWTKVSGASGYTIYRSTSKAGTYTAVKTVVSGTLKYTNTGLSSGKTYYYRVRAYRTVAEQKIYGSYSAVKYLKL